MNGKPIRTISENERYRRGFLPWDETKEAKKNIRVSAWTQFYHKPYQTDWKEAHQKAVARRWRYIDEER